MKLYLGIALAAVLLLWGVSAQWNTIVEQREEINALKEKKKELEATALLQEEQLEKERRLRKKYLNDLQGSKDEIERLYNELAARPDPGRVFVSGSCPAAPVPGEGDSSGVGAGACELDEETRLAVRRVGTHLQILRHEIEQVVAWQVLAKETLVNWRDACGWHRF